MPATEAQIRANQANAARSTGLKTPEGKEASRANALKHGLTGAGLVLPERAAEEVDRRVKSYAAELNPTGEIGVALVRQLALMSVRMETCADYQTAAQAERARQALAEFEAPEGLDPVEQDRLRSQAEHRALFDPSHEASLARRYEAEAHRGFFRALKEFRQLEKAARVEEPPLAMSLDALVASRAELASFLKPPVLDRELDALRANRASRTRPKLPRGGDSAELARLRAQLDVPITVGRGR